MTDLAAALRDLAPGTWLVLTIDGEEVEGDLVRCDQRQVTISSDAGRERSIDVAAIEDVAIEHLTASPE